MKKIVVTSEDCKLRLDAFLSNSLNLSRNIISKAITTGLILLNNKPTKSSYKLRENDAIEYSDEIFIDKSTTIEAQDIELNVVYEDDYLAVINKPKNMLTHPSAYDSKGTLVNALLYRYKDKLSNKQEPQRQGIVHRLDKNTAGLIVIAKDDDTHKNLQDQIKNKTAIRKYKAIALGCFKEDLGIINKPLKRDLKESVKMVISPDGKEAVTHFKVIERFNDATLVELELKTGRTHQIRAHLSYLNHPIFGDNLYNAKGATAERFRNIKTTEQVLQSYYLSFTHPKNNEIMTFELEESDFDKDYIKVIKIMREEK